MTVILGILELFRLAVEMEVDTVEVEGIKEEIVAVQVTVAEEKAATFTSAHTHQNNGWLCQTKISNALEMGELTQPLKTKANNKAGAHLVGLNVILALLLLMVANSKMM